jgi:hypothetical protein
LAVAAGIGGTESCMANIKIKPQVGLYYLVALVLIGIAVWALVTSIITLKELILLSVPILGTFFGATFAYRLNEEKERQKKLDERKGALAHCLFVLGLQMNVVLQLKSDYDKFQEGFERAFNLPAYQPPAYEDLKIPIGDLVFLLDNANDAQLLFDLSIEQERFEQILTSIQLRNTIYVDELQPEVARLGLNGTSPIWAEVKAQLGDKLVGRVMQGTKVAYDHLAASDLSIPEMLNKLQTRAKEIFPGSKFLAFKPVVNEP